MRYAIYVCIHTYIFLNVIYRVDVRPFIIADASYQHAIQLQEYYSKNSVYNGDTLQECTGILNKKQVNKKQVKNKSGNFNVLFQVLFHNAVFYHYRGKHKPKQTKKKKNMVSWLFRIMKLQCLLSLQNMKSNGLFTLITMDYLLYLQKRAFKRLSFVIAEGLAVVICLVNVSGSSPCGLQGGIMMGKKEPRNISSLFLLLILYPPVILQP